MTPEDVFIRELALTPGWRFEFRSGGGLLPEGWCDHRTKIVSVSYTSEPRLRWIIALHELGHARTFPLFLSHKLPRDPIERAHTNYVVEVAAWDWAASVVPPGYETDFEQCREFGLSSYREALTVKLAHEELRKKLIMWLADALTR